MKSPLLRRQSIRLTRRNLERGHEFAYPPGKWLRRREGGNLEQTRSARPDGTNQPEGRPGPPPDPEVNELLLILTLHPRHTKFVSDLARDLDRVSPAQQINESHVVTAMIEACLGIAKDAQRRVGCRLSAAEIVVYWGQYANLQRETVETGPIDSGPKEGA